MAFFAATIRARGRHANAMACAGKRYYARALHGVQFASRRIACRLHRFNTRRPRRRLGPYRRRPEWQNRSAEMSRASSTSPTSHFAWLIAYFAASLRER